jgi:hypothetical protein
MEAVSGTELGQESEPDRITLAASRLKDGAFSRDDLDVYLSAALPQTPNFSLSESDAQDAVLTAVSEVAAHVPSVADAHMNAHTLALGLTAALHRTARISQQTYEALIAWLSSDVENERRAA